MAMGEEREPADAAHLRGLSGRGATDTGHGAPRPDETDVETPPGIQATHAGRPTNSPLVEPLPDTGAGQASTVPGTTSQGGDRRYQGHGRDTEGAFGEEVPE